MFERRVQVDLVKQMGRLAAYLTAGWSSMGGPSSSAWISLGAAATWTPPPCSRNSSISSRERPLVSGTQKSVKMRCAPETAAKSQKVPPVLSSLARERKEKATVPEVIRFRATAVDMPRLRMESGKISEMSTHVTGPSPREKAATKTQRLTMASHWGGETMVKLAARSMSPKVTPVMEPMSMGRRP
eukprot:8985547-Pyramimonas_sp.AAC.1